MKYLKTYEAKLILSLDDIFRDCKPFINELRKCKKNSFLIRGEYEHDVDNIKLLQFNSNDREPRNTPPHVHDYLNNLFEEKFGWKVRNGLFCVGTVLNEEVWKEFQEQNMGMPFETGYGYDTFILFPVGEYEFVYSTEINDLFYEIDFIDDNIKKYEKDIKEIVNTYQSDSLYNAIKSENEICINCNSYYIVSQKYIDELIYKIWL